jgi:hypothetical protein
MFPPLRRSNNALWVLAIPFSIVTLFFNFPSLCQVKSSLMASPYLLIKSKTINPWKRSRLCTKSPSKRGPIDFVKIVNVNYLLVLQLRYTEK